MFGSDAADVVYVVDIGVSGDGGGNAYGGGGNTATNKTSSKRGARDGGGDNDGLRCVAVTRVWAAGLLHA